MDLQATPESETTRAALDHRKAGEDKRQCRKRPDTELPKLLSLLEVQREQLRLFLGQSPPPEYVSKIANELLNEKEAWRASVEAAHVHCDQLNQLLPLVANDDYIHALILAESQQEVGPEGLITIKGLYGEEAINRLLQRYGDGPREGARGLSGQDRQMARELLRNFYRERDDRRRHRRAEIKLQRKYLFLQGCLLVPMLVALGVALFLLGAGGEKLWARLLLVAAAGALGGILAATFMIRDFKGSFLSMQGVRAAALFQPLIGASLGLLAWLVLEAGAVHFAKLKNSAWETQGLLAFASGLSEPLILRIVSRTVLAGPEDTRAH